MRRAPLLAAVACACAVGAAASPAAANGRYPESNQIVFSQHDPDLLLLRVTFGLLVSHDRGRTFDWVCEQSIGFSGVEDPMYTVTPSSSFVATTFQGLTISRDQACNWSFAPGELNAQVFIDLTANPKDPKHIVVFASSYDRQDDQGNLLFNSRIWETTDEAKTFRQLGGKLDPGFLGYTIDLTATDPDRIYITASRNPGTQPKGFLLTSRDHGETWEELEIPLVGNERSVFIAGVDPNDAERVYLRTAAGSIDQPTRLLLREAKDGGAPTVRLLQSFQGAVLGFALSPDGSKVYAGGPMDGVNVASTSDFVFQRRSNQQVQCLAVNADGLWACSNEQSGFVAGISKDDGVTFEPRLHFCDIRGPLACAPGSTTSEQCAPFWAQQKALLGCGLPPPDGGPSDGPEGSSSGGRDGSTSLSGRGGSGCSAAPGGPWGAVAGVVAVAAALVRRSLSRGRGRRS